MKIHILTLLGLIAPLLGIAQQSENNVDQLSIEREINLRKIDSLENRIKKIDKLLSQSSPEAREEAMIAKYGKNKGKMIAQGKVWPTISYEMARDSWGEPVDIKKTETTGGSTEKWTYSNGRYLFFKNGRLENWKE